VHRWSSIITNALSEQGDLIRCNICEMRINVVSIAKHTHAAYHELRKLDLEKEVNRVRTTDCYENNRSVVSMW
jgi:hypothetical protein